VAKINFTQKIIRSNRGFLLITSYMVLIVLIILGSAFFARSISENNLAKIAKNTIVARYAAEKGFACAFYEIKHHPNWITHEISDANTLEPASTGFPAVSLLALNKFNPATYCYEEVYAYFPSGVNMPLSGPVPTSFQVKTYADPADSNVIIVLVKGFARDSAGNITAERLFTTKVSRPTLYDYFIFTPDDYWVHRHNFNAQGGRIQVNGDVIFGEYAQLTLGDGGQLNAGGNFKYYVRPSVDLRDPANAGCNTGGACSKWYLRSPWYVANTSQSQFISPIDYRYFNEPDGHVSGDRYGVYHSVKTTAQDYPPYEILSRTPDNLLRANPSSPWFNVPDSAVKPNIYSCANGINCNPPNYLFYDSQISIDNTTIPNRLGGEPGDHYLWDVYAGEVTQQGNPNAIIVNYTNSAQQPSSTWDSLGLTGKLNHNVAKAKAVKPNIQKYLTAAKNGGLYIYIDRADNKLKAIVTLSSGYRQTFVESGGVITFTYYNEPTYTLIERKTIYNAQSGLANDVAVVNIDQMKAAHNFLPGNGIIYSQVDVGLKNADDISGYPLTTVSEGNILIGGPYNTTDEPSAAIGNKKIYTVSNGYFDNAPQTAPATLHNIEYPYTADPAGYYAANASSMPGKVTAASGYVQYNVSTIGQYGYQPETLERWTYPVDDNNPTGEQTMIERRIQGVQVKLGPSDFNCTGLTGWLGGGHCSNSLDVDGPCNAAGCPASRNRTHPGWPWDMTALLGDPNYSSSPKDVSTFDPRYLPTSGDNRRPPGAMFDDSEFVWLELDNTWDNFNKPCNYIY